MTAKKKETKKKSNTTITSTIAKSDDRTIQINFTIPKEVVAKEKISAIDKLGKEVDVPGFRKGMAPKEKVEESIPENDLKVEIVNKLLPSELEKAINDNKITIAVYPKVELVQTDFDKDWQVRATTCEMPNVLLKDYKKAIKGELSAKKIWTPEDAKKDKGEKEKELTPAEKEQIVVSTLIKNVDVEIPSILVEKDVGDNLSQLLDRLDKLGLTLDGYLESIGKTPTQLREEYEKRAKESIIFNLSLNKIAQEEKITVTESEVDEAVKIASADPNQTKDPSSDQKRVVEGILIRRKTLDMLLGLA